MRTLFSAAAVGLFAAGIGTAQAAELTLSSWLPPAHALTKDILVPWAEAVEEATEGRVTHTLLPKAVAAPPATYDAVADGLADVSLGVHGYTPGRFVLTKSAEFPFLGDDATSISVAYQRIHERYFADKGEHEEVVVLSVFTHGPGHIWNKVRPVAQVSDLEGLKIRVGGGVVNDVTKALGVTSILKPASASFELLNTGVVDGVFFPKESIAIFKLQDLIRHGTTVPGGLYNTSFFMVMNRGAFDALSAEDQDALMSVSGQALARRAGQAWDAADTWGEGVAREAGVEIQAASDAMLADIAERTRAIEEAWYDEAAGKGIDGKAVMEAFRAEIQAVAAGG